MRKTSMTPLSSFSVPILDGLLDPRVHSKDEGTSKMNNNSHIYQYWHPFLFLKH